VSPRNVLKVNQKVGLQTHQYSLRRCGVLAPCEAERHNRAMRVWIALTSAVLLAACAARSPYLLVGPLAGGLDAFLAAHPPGSGQNIRADEVERTTSASYHVVQIADREALHTHATHDITILVLRGSAVFTLDGRTTPLAAGDVVVVPRGRVHGLARAGDVPTVTFVTMTPPLDAPDVVPVDSDGGRR
jgi:quercetin dioxygenase-like cupin family protein